MGKRYSEMNRAKREKVSKRQTGRRNKQAQVRYEKGEK
jgi:hypothetical protein